MSRFSVQTSSSAYTPTGLPNDRLPSFCDKAMPRSATCLGTVPAERSPFRVYVEDALPGIKARIDLRRQEHFGRAVTGLYYLEQDSTNLLALETSENALRYVYDPLGIRTFGSPVSQGSILPLQTEYATLPGAVVAIMQNAGQIDVSLQEAGQIEVSSQFCSYGSFLYAPMTGTRFDETESASHEEELDTVDWDVHVETPPRRRSQRVRVRFKKGSRRLPRIPDNLED